MNYNYLILSVNKLEGKIKDVENLYFETLQKLEEVNKDLSKFDTNAHLMGIIKPFLVEWGTMARVVNQAGLDWNGFGFTIRQLAPEFAKLQGKRFVAIDFDKEPFSTAIPTIYGKLKMFPKLGGSTNVSKVIHLLNPEVFVMWDSYIRTTYHRKNKRINEFHEGYLEFLKEMQKEIMEALTERQEETGRDLEENEKELRKKFNHKTLARLIDEFNYETITLKGN